MSDHDEIRRIAERLRELSGRLGGEQLGDEEAEALAREAAELAAEGSAAIEANLRELSEAESAEGGL